MIIMLCADSSKPDTIVAIKGSSDFEFLPGGSLRILRANRKLAGTYTCLHSPSDNSVSTELRVLGRFVCMCVLGRFVCRCVYVCVG